MADREVADRDVIETNQKQVFRRAVTLRLTRTELWSIAPRGTKVLRLDHVHSLRLEQVSQSRGQTARLIVAGEEGTIVVVPGGTDVPCSEPPIVSAGIFADHCLSRILAAGSAVALMTGLSQAHYNFWIFNTVLAVGFSAVAGLMLVGGTAPSDMLGALPVVAFLPACWINLTFRRPQQVSANTMRDAIGRAFALASS